MTDRLYDVFILHAYQSNSTFTNQLALELKRNGLMIWYSGFELKMSNSIAQNVSTALAEAHYGIIVISPPYLRKQWAMRELKTIFGKEKNRPRLLPVLHRVSASSLQRQVPQLNERYTFSSDHDLQRIVNRVLRMTKNKRAAQKSLSVNPRKAIRFPEMHASSIPGFITLGSLHQLKPKKKK